MTLRRSIGTGAVGVLAIVAALFSMPCATHAGTGLTIQPIKVSQTMKPGSLIEGQITLTNASSEDAIIDVTIQDFIPTAGADTFQFVGRAPGVTTVRDWIAIAGPAHFTFKGGESKQMSYVIKAPADAEPGSHFGVMFFKATRAADADAQIKVGTQVGVLVFVTIPGKFEQKGEVKSFTAPSFLQHGPVPFDMEFVNTGTVHFEPKGTIDITNIFGSKVGSVPIEGYAVLPTGMKNMHFAWNVVGILLGKYTATASVYDVDGNLIASKSSVFYALPVWYTVGFVVTLLLVYLIIRFVRSKVSFSMKIKK